MDALDIGLIAIGLAMDVFAVSLGLGSAGYATWPRSMVRLAFHCGLFQAGMTLLGWAGGTRLIRLISGFDHWVAFGLLAIVGLRMIRSGIHPDAVATCDDPTRGLSLVVISLATSIDAAAVGLSLALLRGSILPAVLAIGFASLAFGLLGSLLGGRLGGLCGKRMEIVGGLILLGIGLRVLWDHLG